MDRAVNRILRRGMCTSHVNLSVSSTNARKMFLDYFEGEHDHLLIPSSPVVPDRDATLSFVNSGMNQFKDVFLGLTVPPSGRVVNSQRCIRIKGKHNDLDQVGVDGYHHTFFEMLGNWSFGDYFKKEACRMSWDLLTKGYNIPKDRLYVTYFGGDEALSLPRDEETREIWAEIGVPPDRILSFGMGDNFWEMASTGPCGPCTEIHYDHEGRADAASLVNAGSPAVTEIWNLVFTEFNRTENGLESLGRHFVDTGMGFERLVAILQGKVSNYETDIFRPLFDVIRDVSGHSGYSGRYDGDEMDAAYRILADHARMLTVAFGDGMIPNMQNKIRPIFRKAWILSRKSFKVEKGLIKELSNHVAEFLASIYPEIGRNLNRVHYIIEEEEEFFRQKEANVMEEWIALVQKYPKLKNMEAEEKQEIVNGFHYLTKNVVQNSNGILSSENAWKLFDTYGVPVKYMPEMALVLGLKFDPDEYKNYEKTVADEQRMANENKFSGERKVSEGADIKLPDLGPDPTLDHFKFEYAPNSEGSYSWKEVPVRIESILVSGESVDALNPDHPYDDNVVVVLDKTNCFHETKETQSDTACLELEGGTVLYIYKVRKLGNKILHYLSRKNFPLSSRVTPNSEGTIKAREVSRLGLMRSYTGLQLLRVLLHSKLKTFLETSSFSANLESCSLCFTSYKENLQLNDILELENAVCDAIESGFVIEREMIDVREINKMENFIRRPGQTFVEAKIPVCKITGRDFTASLPCPGPILENSSYLKDFIITGFKKNGYRIREITAVTGAKAENARLRNNEFLENWNLVRDFHVAEFESMEAVEERIKAITTFSQKFARCEHISHYIKHCLIQETSAKLILLQKYVRRGIRDIRKMKRSWEKT